MAEHLTGMPILVAGASGFVGSHTARLLANTSRKVRVLLRKTMDAALVCGITRFIFTSTMGTLGINPNGPVTEDIPFNWLDRAPPYIRARLEAENTFLAYCREKGQPGIALCVANTYGPQDYQPTPHGDMLWQVASATSLRMNLSATGIFTVWPLPCAALTRPRSFRSRWRKASRGSSSACSGCWEKRIT